MGNRINQSPHHIFDNGHRRQIFDSCKLNPKSFTQLKKIIKISTGALCHHIKVLEKEGLITKEVIKEKGKFKRGKEIKIHSIQKKSDELFKTYEKEAKEHFNLKFPKKLKKEVLILLKKNQPITRWNFFKLIIESGYDEDVHFFYMPYILADGDIDEYLEISKQGEKYLKQHSK